MLPFTSSTVPVAVEAVVIPLDSGLRTGVGDALLALEAAAEQLQAATAALQDHHVAVPPALVIITERSAALARGAHLQRTGHLGR